ncbi:hypothetical protein PP1_031095 [Pseudonocardia sp. P1]
MPVQPPAQRPTSTYPAAGALAPEPGGLRVLRVVTYVLASLASLTFLIVVLWATVKINQIQTAWEESPLGRLSSLSSQSSTPPTDGLGQFCLQFPNAQGC